MSVRASREKDPPTSSSGGGGREYTVLVVDDSASDRRLAGAIMARIPAWKAVFADNGQTALAALEREEPHLVLTDLQMPEMDGLDLVAAVRDKHPLVPVVLMTVYGNEEIA